MFLLCVFVIWGLIVHNHNDDVPTCSLARFNNDVVSGMAISSIQHGGTRTNGTLDQRGDDFKSSNGKYERTLIVV